MKPLDDKVLQAEAAVMTKSTRCLCGVLLAILSISIFVFWNIPKGPDLFLMPYCPYGVEALQKILPFVEASKKRLNLNLYFIAEDKEAFKSGEDQRHSGFSSVTSGCSGITGSQLEQNGRFASLHGPREIEEDMRQILIAKHWPEKLIPYLKLFVTDVNRDWRFTGCFFASLLNLIFIAVVSFITRWCALRICSG